MFNTRLHDAWLRFAVVGACLIGALNSAAAEEPRRLPGSSQEIAAAPPPTSRDQAANPAEGLLPADRGTLWMPGLMASGGIPDRQTQCANLRPLGSGQDDTAAIQQAIDSCPPDQVVRLSEGTFIIEAGKYVLLNKSITLRGAGPGLTTLQKINGARPYPEPAVGTKTTPLIIVGPARWVDVPNNTGTIAATNLAADAAKGAHSITLDNANDFAPGQIVLLDEESGAGWQPDVEYGGQVWASPDWRVVWRKHKPAVQFVDDFAETDFPTTPNTAGGWFSRANRPTAELKQILSVSGSTIMFTSPIHISYRKGHAAQLSRYAANHVHRAGVEDLKLVGGDAGNLRFNWASSSWARGIDCTTWTGECIAIDNSFRIELREFYVHDAAWVHPGGGSYGLSVSTGSSEALIENGISVRANKAMVFRSSGAGSVVGYNYVDMTYISYNGAWIETGINASHMVGPHHVLFEGNYAHNADSDNTHGNSIYHTFFRNHLRGTRVPFDNQSGGRIDDDSQSANKPKRAAGLMTYSYWMSFIANVLGAQDRMSGWRSEAVPGTAIPAIWMLGWGNRTDPRVAATTIRHGNFDYVTNSVSWDKSIASRELPASLYLPKKPAFFDAGRGYVWPWVDPVGTQKLHTLPAKARYEAGTPFTQP